MCRLYCAQKQNQQGALIIAPVAGELTTVPSLGPRWCFAEPKLKMYKRSDGDSVIVKYGLEF